MTVILIDLAHDEDGGQRPVEDDSYVQWVPSRRRDGEGDSVVLPASVYAHLEGGLGSIDLDPTEPGWAWRAIERARGGEERWVLVPDQSEPIQYRDLLDVAPETLDPQEDPEPAWWAYAQSLVRVHRTPLTELQYAELTPEQRADPGVLYLIRS